MLFVRCVLGPSLSLISQFDTDIIDWIPTITLGVMKTAECNDNDYQGDGLRIHDIQLTPTGYSRLVTNRREIMNWNRIPKHPNKKH